MEEDEQGLRQTQESEANGRANLERMTKPSANVPIRAHDGRREVMTLFLAQFI